MSATFVILRGEPVTINGNFMDAITGVQFEPYGFATSAPTPGPTGPLTPAIPITSFTLVDSTTLVVSSATIDALLSSGDLQLITWYEVAVTYDIHYQPPYILAQTCRPSPSYVERFAQTTSLQFTARIASTATLLPFVVAFYDFEGSTSGPWDNKATGGSSISLVGLLAGGATYPSTVYAGVSKAIAYNTSNYIAGNSTLTNDPVVMCLSGNYTVEWSEGPWVHNTFPISWQVGSLTGGASIFIYRDQASARGWRFNSNDNNGHTSDMTLGDQYGGISSSPANDYNVRFALTCQRNTPTAGTATYTLYRNGVNIAANSTLQMNIANFGYGFISMGTAYGGSSFNNRVPFGMYQDEFRLTSKALSTSQMLSGGLIPPSANSTFHCFWRDGAPYSIAGSTPLKRGSPTDVGNASILSTATTFTRFAQGISGAGNSTDHWYLPDTDTSAKLPDSNWTVTVIYRSATSLPYAEGAIFSRGAPGTGYGWWIEGNNGLYRPSIGFGNGYVGFASGADAAGGYYVFSASRVGTVMFMKQNLNGVEWITMSGASAADVETRFGSYFNNSGANAGMTFYEVRITNTGTDSAGLTTLHNQICSAV
jgi:hypothetical protein